jgi:hypothetical protein
MEKKPKQRGLVRAGDVLPGMGMIPQASQPLVPAADPPPIPTDPAHDNPQMSLFRDFLYNREDERESLSNAIDLWDSVPRYSVNRQTMSKNRLHGRFLEKHTTSFQHRGQAFTCMISPARIKDVDGQERDFYPSVTEELIEDALRRLATEQQAGFFDRPNYRSGVVFSLYALREELKKRGHARSYQEIVAGLNILSGAVIEIVAHNGGECLAKSPFLPSLVAVSKSKLIDDPKAKWAVHFHPLVTGSIDKVTYRQFNYDRLMKHNTQLARWLHRQLVLKFTFADFTRAFEMRYSTVKRDSGLLNGYTRERAAIKALEEAFGELKQQDIISKIDRVDVMAARKKIVDVVFKIWPSYEFIREVKAANKRQTAASQRLPR